MRTALALEAKQEGPVEKWMTKADVARVLGITPDAVLYLERKGVLTSQRTQGGVRLFPESEVLQLATKRDLERAERQAGTK